MKGVVGVNGSFGEGLTKSREVAGGNIGETGPCEEGDGNGCELVLAAGDFGSTLKEGVGVLCSRGGGGGGGLFSRSLLSSLCCSRGGGGGVGIRSRGGARE